MKRTSKRIVVLGLITVLLFGALAACSPSAETDGEQDTGQDNEQQTQEETGNFNESGLPIVDEQITLSFVAPKAPLAPDFNEMSLIQQIEEDTNISVEWENIPDTDYPEKKNLLLASNDLPDAFYNAGFTDHEIVKYGESGTLIPLEDLIEKHAPNLQKVFEQRPELKSMVTAPNGHIYTLPSAVEMGLGTVPFFTGINTKWLDELDLERPETLDEFHDVLVAFKNEDPNGNGEKDEIPLSFMNNWWCADIGDLLFGAFGVPDVGDKFPGGHDHRIVIDGEVIFTPTHPRYKEAIKYFHGWYEEGLVDPESFTQEASQYLAKGKTEDPTLGSFIWWEIPEVVGPDRADDYAILGPLEGPHGDKVVARSNLSDHRRAGFAITSANEHPEATMRWVDRLYDPYLGAQMEWGPVGEVFEEDANGMLVQKELPEDVVMGEFRQKVAPNGVAAILSEDFGTVVEMEPRARERLDNLEEHYAPYMLEENYPQVFFSPEQLEEINMIEQDIMDFVHQKRAEWIVRGGVEEEWDAYLSQLEQMGLNRLMEIYQEGYDQFKAKQ